MLREFVANKSVRLNAVLGFYPAAAVGDDIEVYADEARSEVVAKLHGLRQQAEKDGAEPFFCVSDFVAPKGSGLDDYIGMFACSAGARAAPAAAAAEGTAGCSSAHSCVTAPSCRALMTHLQRLCCEPAVARGPCQLRCAALCVHGCRPRPG